MAGMVASQVNYIDATIAFNGGGRKFIDDVLHSMKAEMGSGEAYQEASNGFKGFHNHVLNSEPFDLNISGHGYVWWRNMFEIDQTAVLSQVNSPLLLIQAGMDKNVSVELATIQADTLQKSKSNIAFKLYEELDHSLKTTDGESAVSLVLKDVQSWLPKRQ